MVSFNFRRTHLGRREKYVQSSAMTPIQEALPTAAGIAFSILVSYDVKGSYISVVGVACTAVHAQLCLYAD